MIGLAGVSLVVDGQTLLRSVSCTLAPRDVLCIVGGSGSGKSLLLSLLLKEYDPTTGSVDVDGIDLRILPPPILQLYRQRLGVCFQDARLLPQLSVGENIALPEVLRGQTEEDANETARRLLRSMGIKDLATARIHELSPGQQRLISIARAFIGNPSIILLDEPTCNLDDEEKKVFHALLKSAKKNGTSVLILTRDSSLAEEIGSKTLHLTGGVLQGSSAGRVHTADEEDFIPSVSKGTLPSSKGGHSVKITAING